MKKKTHEEYVEELKRKNPNVEVVGTYIDANTKIMHHCLIHDIFWETNPSRALYGCGCEQCRIEKFKNSNTKTHEEYVEEVKRKNPNVEVIGKYINMRTKILHRCKIHNIIWSASPMNILKGCGCKECGKLKIKDKNGITHDEYVNKLLNVSPDIIVLEKYINTEVKIKHKCKICGYEWYAKPGNILAGKGCPKCAGNILKTHEEYLMEVQRINPNIEVIGTYVNSHTKILHRCKIDGYQWMAAPSTILHGYGCPQCNQSHGEREISFWLVRHNIKYIPQKRFDDCRDIHTLPFDFYIPELNICVEYDGEQHFKSVDYFGGEQELNIRQAHDKIKTDYCNDNNISLLRIRYDDNVEEKLNNFIH